MEKESKITKQMREGRGRGRGRGEGPRHHLPEIMKRSKTHKSSHCHFLCLIYAQLRRPNNANECRCLLMLTTEDNFGIQLHPDAWRMDGSLPFYRPLSQQQ